MWGWLGGVTKVTDYIPVVGTVARGVEASVKVASGDWEGAKGMCIEKLLPALKSLFYHFDFRINVRRCFKCSW